MKRISDNEIRNTKSQTMVGLSSFFNRFNCVKQVPVFAKLNWFELRKIASKAIVVEYKKGDLIIKLGSPPDYFYCLISGRIQAYSIDEAGNKDNLDFIHRGMHFGIISVLTGEDHSLNFEAINDSVVLQIPQDEFQKILKSIPQLGVELSQILSKRIRRKVTGTKAVFESTIISIYSPIKGTGSSTYAINLALSLEKETNKKVVYVNIHTQQNQTPDTHSTKTQGPPKWKTPAVQLNEIVGDHEKIDESVIKDDLKVDMINVALDSQDKDVTKQISPFVSALVGNYHYVVVDLPNEMDEIVLETLTQSDSVHLITTDRRKDLELIRRVIDRLEVNLKERFQDEKIKVIIRSIQDKIYLSFEQINKFIDYDVYTMLPQINETDFNVQLKSNHLNFLSTH